MHSWATEEPCAELQRLGQGQAGGRSHAFTFGESRWLRQEPTTLRKAPNSHPGGFGAVCGRA